MKYFSRRNFLGALLFLILVGEPTVGLATGLFLPPGLLVLGGLYLVLFWLYEALVVRFKLTFGRLIPLTFALYSVLVTGLLHGEIADYVTHPDRGLITTMIRLQCSLFPVFAYYLLNRWLPRQPSRVMSVKKATVVTFLFFLLLTPSKKFGFITLVNTIRVAPVLSLAFILLGLGALFFALRPSRARSAKPTAAYSSRSFTVWSWLLLLIGCIPALPSLLVLLVLMPLVTAVYARQASWRQAPS